jgi:hypothetical protein
MRVIKNTERERRIKREIKKGRRRKSSKWERKLLEL